MKIALIGYGKMGRMIDKLAPAYDVEVVSRFDSDENLDGAGLTPESMHGADVAIEFTHPHAAFDNIARTAALGVNLVVGTTGWFSRLKEVEEIVAKHGIGLVWSPNFSIGINAFMHMLRAGAKVMSKQESYGAWAYEIHHDAKVDAPSGTLIKLVETMVDAGYNRDISIASNRAGSIPGTHEIGWDSPADTITLRHTARTREGFAVGALIAAKWIAEKRGVYEFSDIVFE